MKHFYVVLYFAFVNKIIGDDYNHFLSELNHKIECPLRLIHTDQTWSLLLDLTTKLEQELLNCLIKGEKEDTRWLIISEFNERLINNLTSNEYNSKGHPITIIINNLNYSVIGHPLIKHFLAKSQWSIIYFIIDTKEISYSCQNGAFENDTMLIIEDYFNEIWQKYQAVNVVMTFPDCPRYYIIFSEVKELNNTDNLYRRKITIVQADDQKNLQRNVMKKSRRVSEGYPLRANIFDRFPTSINDCSGMVYYVNPKRDFIKNFCGMDAMIMSDVVKHFKFNLSFPDLGEDGSMYGFLKNNKTLSGTLKHIVQKNIDVSFNSRFMANYMEKREYDFLLFVSVDALCLVTPRPDFVPLWHYPYNVYSMIIWALLVVVLSITGLFTWLIVKYVQKPTKKSFSSFVGYTIDCIITGLFGISMTRRFIITRAFCLGVSIILSALYQSHINYVFTTLVHYDSMKTIEEVYRSCTIYLSPSIADLLKPPSNDLQETILAAMVTEPPTNGKILFYYAGRLAFLLEHPNTASVERKADIILEIFKYHTDDRGFPKLYVIEECFRQYYLSYISRIGFLFNEQLATFIARLNEAGLPSQYYTWTRYALRLPKTSFNMGPEPRPFSKITLGEQIIPFYILFIGYVSSTIVFVVEIWQAQRKAHIKPIIE